MRSPVLRSVPWGRDICPRKGTQVCGLRRWGPLGGIDCLPGLCPGQKCLVRAAHGDTAACLSVHPASSAVFRGVLSEFLSSGQCPPRPRNGASPRGPWGHPSSGATPPNVLFLPCLLFQGCTGLGTG